MKVRIITERDHRLDTIKTVMIMGIVIEHSMLIYGYPREHEIIWGLLIGWLMPLFTFISGYLYKQRTLKELNNKYLYPMILFSAINFIIGYFFYNKYHTDINFIGYAMWYLWALFWYAIFTPPLIKKVSLPLLFMLSICVSVIFMLISMPYLLVLLSTRLQINRIIGFFPFFLLGIIMRKHSEIPLCSRKSFCALFVIVMIGYLLLCFAKEGLAYKASFYLIPSSSWQTILQIVVSYPLIMLLCISLLFSLPRKETWLSRYGSRTLYVYLLHMLVIFPLCYGVFLHLEHNVWIVVLNSLLACFFCAFFFSDKIKYIMKLLLSKPRWKIALVLYTFSLVLVNSSILIKVFNRWTNF